MTHLPDSRRIALDPDALLARGLDLVRADLEEAAASRLPAPRLPGQGLAERVLAAARAGDADAVRFARLARVYAAAAAVLLVVGVGGSVMVRRPALSQRAAPRLDDLEVSRLAREAAVTLDDQHVGGK
jgi:hypothetical protein